MMVDASSTEETTEETSPFGDQEIQPETDEVEEPDNFPREYVQGLREEAKNNRQKAKDAEEAREALTEKYRRTALNGVLSDVLRDPVSLPWRDSFETPEGDLDTDAIRAAADELIGAKPSLALPRGDVMAGYRDEAPAVSLMELMRG